MVYGVYKPIIYGFMVFDLMYIYIYYIRMIAIVNSCFFIYWNCLYHLFMVLGDITEVLEMVSVFLLDDMVDIRYIFFNGGYNMI